MNDADSATTRLAECYQPGMRVLLLSAWMTGVAVAGEVPLPESEVPTPVRTAVTSRYPNAVVRGFAKEVEHGKTTYEAQLTVDNRKLDVSMTAAGDLVAEEETIAPEAAPYQVRAALKASEFGKWTISTVERIRRPRQPDEIEYEIRSGRKKVEAVFSIDGRLLRVER